MSDIELVNKQREIQRTLGRCLLLLQQYELIAKHLVAHHVIDGGTVEEIKSNLAERVRSVANLTLGQIAKYLAGGVFRSDDQTEDAEGAKRPAPEALKTPRIRTTSGISFTAQQFDEFKSQLEELVAMRNGLVHHFMEHFPIFQSDTCDAALVHLDKCTAVIEHHVTVLKSWDKHMQEARHHFVAIMSLPHVQAMLAREFAPNPPADIGPEHPLVVLLVQAEGVVGENGWTLLDDAIRHIQASAPGDTPKKHKVRNWLQVFRRTEVLEVRKEFSAEKTDVAIWYRSAS